MVDTACKPVHPYDKPSETYSSVCCIALSFRLLALFCLEAMESPNSYVVANPKLVSHSSLPRQGFQSMHQQSFEVWEPVFTCLITPPSSCFLLLTVLFPFIFSAFPDPPYVCIGSSQPLPILHQRECVSSRVWLPTQHQTASAKTDCLLAMNNQYKY